MKILFFFMFAFLVSFSSCDDSYQYDVYAKNTTEENIKVIFKSPNNSTGTEEQSISLKSGEMKRIISTKNIDSEEKEKTAANHCQLAAEYVKAFRGDAASKLDWCNDDIKFEMEDIGQWTFTIEYGPEHF